MKVKDPFTIQTDNKEIKDKELENYTQGKNMGDSVPLLNEEKEPLSLTIDLKKIRWLFYIIVLGLLIISLRVGYLQIVKGKEFRQSAEENRVRIENIKASRGIIYDKNNKILAHNIPNFILNIIPADLPSENNERNIIFEKISSIIDIKSQDISSLLVDVSPFSYQPITVKEHIDYQKAMLIEIEVANLPGVKLEVSATREYLTSQAFSHILGYTGKITNDELQQYNTEQNQVYQFNDYLGKTGLELYYENELRGKPGKKQVEVDSLGKEKKVLYQDNPINGDNLVLNLDSQFQEILWNLINDKVKNSKSITGAAAVALNPNNGEILAIVSSPGFDNNKFVTGLQSSEYQNLLNDPKKPLFDRAISGEYPSGSTIKPVWASAALQEGVITPSTTVMSTGGIKIGDWFFPDWKAGGHGLTDVRKALAESVNTFFYTVGGGYGDIQGLGIELLKKYAELFGLNHQLGIDLPGEASGFIPSKAWKESVKKEKWYIGDTYHLSIGQGDLLVTPLQVSSYMATVANGGILFKPQIVSKITDASGNLVKEMKPEIIRENFIKPEYLQVVREGLRQAVTSGSSRAMADLPFTSAGKTGTAQFGTEDQTHAWFTTFAPYEDPQVVMTVLVEGGGEGNVTALPIAKEALKWWFANK